MEEIVHKEYGHGSMEGKLWRCEGIRLSYARMTFKGYGNFSAGNSEDVVRLHFGMKGDYRFTYHQLDKSFDLIGGHHNVMYSMPFSMVVENKTPAIETFGIQYPRDLFFQFAEQGDELLKRFAEKVVEGKNAILSDYWGSIDPAMQLSIQEVIHQNYSGEMQQLFLLSKALELLVLSASSCARSQGWEESFLKNKSDKEKIIAARDLVNELAHCPPNLPAISRAVGLNEFKLKKGFKEMFQTTVFGYLTQQRLYLAQRYLLDTVKPAADIAQELGYATPQHFNNAFKKKFGVTPQMLRKNP